MLQWRRWWILCFFGWGCHHCFWAQFLDFPTYSPISEGDDGDNGCGDKGNTVGGCGGWCLVRGLRKMVWVGQDYHLFFLLMDKIAHTRGVYLWYTFIHYSIIIMFF